MNDNYWFKGGLILLIIVAGFWGLADDDEDDHHRGRALRELAPVQNAKWKEECSSCHMLYHPSLLPKRSWEKIMGGLDHHFGENASLDPAISQEIQDFLTKNSSDQVTARRAKKFDSSIPRQDVPLRISDTPYFIRKHDELSPKVFKRKSIGFAGNCVACHKNAEKGYFNENEVRIPK